MEVVNPVLTHLQSKTRVLTRLGELTREFARSFDLDGLAAFERKRERLLKVFALHDQRVSEGVQRLTFEQRGEAAFLAALRAEVVAQEREIRSIIAADEIILTHVRETQVDLARQISRNSKQSGDLARFKSEWLSRSGEELDSRA